MFTSIYFCFVDSFTVIQVYVSNLTLYARCITLQYVSKPTRCTTFL